MVPIVKQSFHCWIRLYAAETQHWRFCHLVSWETQQPGYVNSVKACWLTTVKKAMNLLHSPMNWKQNSSLLQYATGPEKDSIGGCSEDFQLENGVDWIDT